MYQVTKQFSFCYGHRLLNYEGKCRHLHGHNARVDIELSSQELDERGMVRDFVEIKQQLKSWVDEALDHKMLLDRSDPVAKVLTDLGEPCYLMENNPTAENIARLIFDYATAQKLPVREVRLWETETSYASYRSNP